MLRKQSSISSSFGRKKEFLLYIATIQKQLAWRADLFICLNIDSFIDAAAEEEKKHALDLDRYCVHQTNLWMLLPRICFWFCFLEPLNGYTALIQLFMIRWLQRCFASYRKLSLPLRQQTVYQVILHNKKSNGKGFEFCHSNSVLMIQTFWLCLCVWWVWPIICLCWRGWWL